MNITSSGAVFGKVDPALLAETKHHQSLFNSGMVKFRLHLGRQQIFATFHTKQHMPAVFLAAGTFPGLANVEVHSPSFVNVFTPYRRPEDVEAFRKHFIDIWQMTQTSENN
jgi:hypothetical protein